MKYRPSLRLTRLAGAWLQEALPGLFRYTDWDLIIPLPSSPRSFYRRLYNQCHILAAQIAGVLAPRARLDCLSLRHCGCRAPQASLAHDKRISNVRTAFRADQRSLTGRRILLIDDVITTGATSTAAALALCEAQAATVDLLALARAHVWSEYRAEIFRRMRA